MSLRTNQSFKRTLHMNSRFSDVHRHPTFLNLNNCSPKEGCWVFSYILMLIDKVKQVYAFSAAFAPDFSAFSVGFFLLPPAPPVVSRGVETGAPSGPVFFGRRIAWMLGKTPPWAMVTPDNNLFNSSSFLMANWRWRGMIRVFLLSRAALPANSRISADKYSRTAPK